MMNISSAATLKRIACSIYALLALLAFGAGMAGAAEIEAYVDRNEISRQESVVLTLIIPGTSNDAPDMSQLEKDFDVLGRNSASRVSIVNGQTSATQEWRMELAPKRVGDLTIPSLTSNGRSSDPITIKVTDVDLANQRATNQPTLIDIVTDRESVPVQSQLRYTVRILTRVQLSDAGLTEPEAGDALIERVGDDKRSEEYINGERYTVIERSYAIFPQHSGQLTITSPVLTAAIPVERRARRPGILGGGALGLFTDMRRVQLRGNQIDIEVTSPPAAATAGWLPASAVTLAETWQPDPPEFKVGEPVTREITIVARGLTAAQLPDLDLPVDPSLKQYPDQPVGETRSEGNDLVATRRFRMALVPTRGGEFTLPALSLAWWDTTAGRMRRAELPARTITVAPGAVVTTPAAPAARTSVAAADDNAPPADVGVLSSPATQGSAGYWPWATGILAILWAVTLVALFRKPRNPVSEDADRGASERVLSIKHAVRNVEIACHANDAQGARRALLAWASLSRPTRPRTTLHDLARQVDDINIAECLSRLDRALYARGEMSWDGEACWQTLRDYLQRQTDSGRSHTAASPLPALYPAR
ncbi:MAG: protein BatD [Gammaproteobacteria bacterium]|nr:protein BatD [Gammaproteobacteria bacterium]